MHDSVPYLLNALPAYTDILHEYFVPRSRFVSLYHSRSELGHLVESAIRVLCRERAPHEDLRLGEVDRE
jgi:hypothetical protein